MELINPQKLVVKLYHSPTLSQRAAALLVVCPAVVPGACVCHSRVWEGEEGPSKVGRESEVKGSR